MIVERESIMNEDELNSPLYFPPYIVTRKAYIEGENKEQMAQFKIDKGRT